MARICLVTPGHLATNPRLVKEADALADAGHEVRIIAADYAPWAREKDAAFDGRPWQVVARLPFGPDAPKSVRVRQLLRNKTALAACRAGFRSQAVMESAWHQVTPDLTRAALASPADLYIAHYVAALPAAAKAAKKHGALYAFDAEDFHLGDPPEGSEHEWQRRMTRAIEGRYLPGAAYVAAASPGIADAYAEAYGIARPTVVLNVFPLSQAPERPTPAGTASPGPSVYWFSQTIGADRGLECAVAAIARAQSRPHLYLRGTPAAGFVERLQKLAAAHGVAERLHLLEPAPPQEMERLAAQYDVGLVGETGHTPNRRIALTNKQFTYLLAGIPAVMSDIPAHRSFADGLGPAVRLYRTDDPGSLAQALDALLLESDHLAEARAHAFRLGQERFNWEGEREGLLDCISQPLNAMGETTEQC